MQNKFPVILKSAILSVVVSFILSIVLAFLILKTDIYGNGEWALTFLFAILPPMLGGFLSGKVLKEKGLLTGLSLSLIYYAIFLGICLLLHGETVFSVHTLLMFLSVILSGMAGGIIAMPR